MQNVVYADVLVFLNTVITFLLLLTVKQFAGVRCTNARIVTASFVGGAYSLVLLAPQINVFLLLVMKLAMSVTIVMIAFRTKGIRKYVKCVALFYIASFLYAGLMYSVNLFLRNTFVFVHNGAVYFDVSAYFLIGISALAYGVLRLLRKKVFNVKQEDLICEMRLTYNNRAIMLNALLDSGNTLKDVYTGSPVVIVSQAAAQQLTGVLFGGPAQLENIREQKIPVRLLPVKTVSGEAVLPAFSVQKAEISAENLYRSITRASVAVAQDAFSGEGYQALIGTEFIK